MALKKPSDFFAKEPDKNEVEFSGMKNIPEKFDAYKSNVKNIETLNEFTEVFGSFKDNVVKIQELESTVEELREEISKSLSKEDLDNAIMSNLLILEDNIKKIQLNLKGINRKDLSSIREEVEDISNKVSFVFEEELPKYRSFIKNNEISLDKRLASYQENIDYQIQEKFDNLESQIEGLNGEALSNVYKVLEEYQKEIQEKVEVVQQSVHNLIEQEVPKYQELLINSKISNDEKIEAITEELVTRINSLTENSQKLNEDVSKKASLLETSIENKVSTLENYILTAKKEVEETSSTYKKLYQAIEAKGLSDKIKFEEQQELITRLSNEIENAYQKIEVIKEEVENNSQQQLEDKVEELQKLFVKKLNVLENDIEHKNNKLKEVNANLLDDVFVLKENISQISFENINKKYDQISKKVSYIEEIFNKFNEKTVLNEGLLNEPPTVKNNDPLTPLDQKFVTFQQLQDHYRLFINRIQQQLASVGGGGETQLKYLDDIVGIATNASVYDQKVLTYDHSIRKFEFRNIPENAVSIAEENIVYVAKDGSDSNDGTLTSPKLTIKAAVESIVSAGVTDRVVRVAPGTYIENNPIILPDEVTVIGQSLRETTVIPQNDDQDLFYVGNGNYIAEMSFRGSLPNKAIVAFDPEKPRYIVQSPYIQNCTNFIPDSIGLKVDGNAVIGPIKSMVLDSYTQYNQGGIGVSITNQGYAQLVSLFTICDDIAIYCGNGGACDLTNSNSSFGNYGLVADGVSPKKYSGIITSPSASLSDTFVVDLSTPELSVSNAVYDNVSGIVTITTSLDHNFNVGMGVSIAGLGFTCSSGPGILTYPSGNKGYTFNVNQVVSSNEFSAYVGVSTLQHTYVSGGTVKTEVVRPYDGQVIYFNDLYNTVETITITDGGSGYTSPPIVTIDAPSASWGVRAKAIATVENGAVTQIDILSNGRGYTTTPSVTFSAPQSGINTAIGAAVLTPEYYTINKSTEISNGISTITLNENVPFAVGVGTTVNFFKQSRILATGHSFEFIGSGTDIANSIPFNGGSPPIPENETDSRNGGLVVYTSTNQSGNFKIGDGVTINQNTSSITGQAYEKSLVSTMTPYILSLGAL